MAMEIKATRADGPLGEPDARSCDAGPSCVVEAVRRRNMPMAKMHPTLQYRLDRCVSEELEVRSRSFNPSV